MILINDLNILDLRILWLTIEKKQAILVKITLNN